MLMKKRERFPRNLFYSFNSMNGFSSAVQHSILFNVSLACVFLLQTLLGFKHFISTVKHLKPASAVMLFPPTNPFLVLAVLTLPGSFYISKSKQTLKTLSFLFLGSWVPELLYKAGRDIIVALCLSSSYRVLPLSFTSLICCRNTSDPSQ